MALPSIIINTIDGVKNTDKELLKMAKSFKAGKLFTIKSIMFYKSLPFIFSGMRIAVGKSIIGLVVAEIFGYGIGLGYLVSFYGANFAAAKLIFIIFVLLGIALTMTGLLAAVSRIVIRWQ